MQETAFSFLNFYRLHFVAASTKPWNKGCGLFGLDFNSG